MDDIPLLVTEIYLLGLIVNAMLAAWLMPKIPGLYLEQQQKAMKTAFDPGTPRSKVKAAKKTLENARDQWHFWSRSLDMISAADRLPLVALLYGAIWPGFFAVIVLTFVSAMAFVLWDAVNGTKVVCDECERSGRWAWTLKSSRSKMASLGWVVNQPKGEDYCPVCAPANQVPAT